MKCVKCGTDNDLRDRTKTSGRCKQCNHPFAFEPSMVTNPQFRFTDVFFQRAIQDISNNGTLYFTPRQLQYLLDRRLNKQTSAHLIVLVVFALLLCVFGIILLLDDVWIGIFIVSFSLVILISARKAFQARSRPRPEVITLPQVREWVRRWQRINGETTLLLPPLAQSTQPRSISPDVSAYSFDRAVICDREEIAQFLIANNFHFENNCAVLSSKGYPLDIFSTVMEMLKRNPDLKVYALHNADPQGVNLVHQLRNDPQWFSDRPQQVFDLGLSPYQVIRGKRFRVIPSPTDVRQPLSDPARLALSPQELQWLEAGNAVELESLMPQRLLQVLNSGIARSEAGDLGGSNFMILDTTGGSFYSVDSFG